MKRKHIGSLRIFCGFLLFYIVLLQSVVLVKAEAPPKPQALFAKAACLIDADLGRVLFGKEENLVLPNASTTKIMTCILALESLDLQTVVTASQKAAAQPKVHLGVFKGEEFLLEDLLYSLMLESHNDTAVMLAEAVSGSCEVFAEKMNQKAKEIGCSATHFVSPNGLDWEDEAGAHGTTALDLARIMRYCTMESPKKELFRKITAAPSYTFWDREKKRSFDCYNHNALLSMFDGVFSGKTGFTSKAGYCYVGALEKDGKTFFISLLSCGNNKSQKWTDAKLLLNYGLRNYEYREVFEAIPERQTVRVKDGQYSGRLTKDGAITGLTLTVPPTEQKLRVLLREGETVRIDSRLPKSLKAPIAPGEEVGGISYFLNGEKIAHYPVVTTTGVRLIDFSWTFKKILSYFWI